MKVLVTGGVGFIGSHLGELLLDRGESLVILDNFDPFYAPAIKERNLAELRERAGDRLRFVRGDLREPESVAEACRDVDAVVHLAALAGVRPSIERPAEYWDVNLVGTQRLFDALADRPEIPVVFGSSSSVYGGNEKVPFHEDDEVLQPYSPYAATKRAGELLCAAEQRLSGRRISCLRFFTVYGPRQRPEMAIHKFTRMIHAGQAVPMFGDGTSARDYTFVSDIVDGVARSLDHVQADAHPGFRIYNLGGSAVTSLADLIKLIGEALGVDARIESMPDQAGDVPRTYADVSRAADELGYSPRVAIAEGVDRFVTWYRGSRERGEVD